MVEEGVKLNVGRLISEKSVTEVDGDVFKFRGAASTTGIIKFLEPLSPLFNYFELLIVNRGREASIGIGAGEWGYPLTRMPGWNRNSIGYHADDGRLYQEQGMGRAFGPTCSDGDRMGCGVSFDTGATGFIDVFFSKNGKKVGDTVRIKRPIKGIYPLIGLHSPGESVRYLGHWCLGLDGSAEAMDDDSSPSSIWLRANAIRFLDDGLTLEYNGYGGDGQDVAIAQWRYPLDRTHHYFELDILGTGSKGAVAIGLANTTYPLHLHPGWEDGAVGYHADDGKLFKEKGYGEPMGPSCSEGDSMGCGIKFPTDPQEGSTDSEESEDEEEEEEEEGGGLGLADGLGWPPRAVRGLGDLDLHRLPMLQAGLVRGLAQQLPPGRKVAARRQPSSRSRSGRHCLVYFTKNGEHVGETECCVPRGGFYPVVAMLSPGEKLRVNFHPISG